MSIRDSLRRLILPIFERINPGDISIRHHYTGDRLKLHSFRHKTYWWRGKRRERRTMKILRAIVDPGAMVIDVGGHIGYLTLYLAKLVGPEGQVAVFEPGPNNLRYLRQNVKSKSNVVVVEAAVSAAKGTGILYVENLSGQNNSLVPDFGPRKSNADATGISSNTTEAVVELTTLNDFCNERKLRPQLVKIDVEGFELEALRGASQLLQDIRPVVLVEITGTNWDPIWNMFHESKYVALTHAGDESPQSHVRLADNVLFCPAEKADDTKTRLRNATEDE